MCRAAAKAFEELCDEHGEDFKLMSMYDMADDQSKPYIRKASHSGFGGKRVQFVRKAVQQGRKSRIVVLSHINLALPGLLIKMFSPSTKVVLIAHGIEVWDRKLSIVQKKFLKKADLIAAVSSYTKNRMKNDYQLNNVEVLNDCLDPFLPQKSGKILNIRSRHGIQSGDFVLLTVTRLAFTEINKNYDLIIRAIGRLKESIPEIKYLFIGKYDPREKERLEELAEANGVGDRLFFTGFVSDDTLPAYYDSTNLYVMPSKKEGFGLTFIEAAYYGLPVIAGNKDGSTDALLNGELGILIDPDSEEELQAAIIKSYNDSENFKPKRDLVLKHFGFDVYKKNWEKVVF